MNSSSHNGNVDESESFILYSAIGKGKNRHRYSLQFATSENGKHKYIPQKEVSQIFKSTGHTIRRLVVEEDEGNRILGEPNHKTLNMMQEYCTGLHELQMINFVEIPEDVECILGNLRKLSLTNCTLAQPLRQYLCDGPLQQLELTKTTVEFDEVKLPQLKYLKVSNCIVMDLGSLLENSPDLEVLELVDCQFIGKSIDCPKLLQKIHTLNLKSNDNSTLGYLIHFRDLTNLVIKTSLVADEFIQAIIARDHKLQYITLDAFVSARTMELLIEDSRLHLRIEGQCVVDHFAALAYSHPHELSVENFEPTFL